MTFTETSSFLPSNFNNNQPITLIAGRAFYPILTAQRIRAAGLDLKLVAFEGETEESLWESFLEKDRIRIKVGQVGRLLKALKHFQSPYALMAGQITPGRLFRDMVPDLKALTLLASLKERNAESIFGALAKEMSLIGTQLLDARAFLEDQLATSGLMTPGLKLSVDKTYIEHGIKIAKAMADLDVGQGVVVRKGTVLAVEAFEGTDAMLKRAGSFKTEGLIFVKTVKPKQDWRFDVPVVGMQTLLSLKEAGIHTVALEAGSVIMLDKSLLLDTAKKYKICFYGY